MELTVYQALQRGVVAHKEGKLQEAEKLYRSILSTQPQHADANHNLGVLAVEIGKVAEALSFFQLALEANPKQVQFWLSYIDALIKVGQLDNARQVLRQGKDAGLNGKQVHQLEAQLSTLRSSISLPTSNPSKQQIDGLIALYSESKLQEAVVQGTALESRFPNDPIIPSILGAIYAGLRRYEEAITSYNKAIDLKPDYAEAYNNCAIALKGLGQHKKAISNLEKAIKINPNYLDALYNLGNSLREFGRSQEAIVNYNKVISLKPDHVMAHNNLGNALKAFGKPKDAIASYNKAIELSPHYGEAYNNIAIILKELGMHQEAISNSKKAIQLKPEAAELYNNLGDILNELDRYEEAIDSFGKALTIRLDSTDTYNNLGIALTGKGNLEDAIQALNKALFLKSDNSRAWNNVFFPLQIIKTKTSSNEKLTLNVPKDKNSKYAQISKSILNYRLGHAQANMESSLNETLSLIASGENVSISNPKHREPQASLEPILPDKVIALFHFGRSGTGLLHSLIDGHPEVSTLPSIYFSEYFDYSIWDKIISGGWDEMIDRFMAIYDVLFDASSIVPVQTKSNRLIYNIGKTVGMTNIGERGDEKLTVDKKLFRSELSRLINYYGKLDSLMFFKLIHKAFDKAINDKNQKNVIFYHIHNPDTFAELNFLRSAPNAKWIMMVREPVQSCESWIRGAFEKNDYTDITNKIYEMLIKVDKIHYNSDNLVGIRVEDLKESPRKIIPILCNWMGIQENEALYKMTAQGKKWWGDPTSPDYLKDGMVPFGRTSIKRKVGLIFSENDQFILRTLFYPFSLRFGYVEEDSEKFRSNLQQIKPLLEKMFDFERTIVRRTKTCSAKFKKSGSYLYLRSILVERWKLLNEIGTYPNMVNPLKIDPK